MISQRTRLTGLMMDRPGFGRSGIVSMRFGGGMSCRDICNICKRVRECGFFFLHCVFAFYLHGLCIFDYYVTYSFIFFWVAVIMEFVVNSFSVGFFRFNTTEI